jgi:hypothetical protein
VWQGNYVLAEMEVLMRIDHFPQAEKALEQLCFGHFRPRPA